MLQAPDQGTGRLVGAVLTGGQSVRMGRAKHEMRLPDARTMVDAVIAALEPVCDEVVLLGRAAPGDAGSRRTLFDLRPGSGPLGGIEALLASGLASDYLVCPCDAPLVTTEILRSLTHGSSPMITVLRCPGDARPQPLPIRISAQALPAVRESLDRNERAIHRLLKRGDVSVDVVEAPEAWRARLRNINSPEEFERMCADLRYSDGPGERT